MGIFGYIFGKKDRPPADFSNVRSGGSSTATAPSAGGGPEVGPPVTTAPAIIRGQTYVVVSGDSLSRIAKRKYGDGSKWPRIYEANRDIIEDPNLIYPGQELRIPTA